ncbi:N,N-dimethylformamidase beta subunit family domain-containing protein [Rhodosalinus sp. FB01]|uniref:N,N-dimethylformamidase beta subunit family domain-containing protein n=1 Tax=Rhodosalinus sp. FB01 TaxID=3239194 RepID=UPI00352438FC
MYRIMGYPDKITLREGEAVRFMVSCEDITRYRADIVRVHCGDDGPGAPGLREEVVETPVSGSYPGRWQPIEIGSHAEIAHDGRLDTGGGLTIALSAWPTLLNGTPQVLAARWQDGADGGAARGWQLLIDADGTLRLEIADGSGGLSAVAVSEPLRERMWVRIVAGHDPGKGRLCLSVAPACGFPHDALPQTADAGDGAIVRADAGLPVSFAAAPSASDLIPRWRRHYNGRIEAPALFDCAPAPALTEALVSGGPAPVEFAHHLLAQWDFSQQIPTDRILDIGPHRFHGRLMNQPTRGVTGVLWDGTAHRWTELPKHFGAVHFHDDDLDDCLWEADFAFTVPEGLPSGIYAARLRGEEGTAGAEEELRHITFFVSEPVGKPRHKVAFLASTVTYMAYSNGHYRLDHPLMEMKSGNFAPIMPGDVFLDRRRDLGMSPYDTHSDGSGVCYSSRLRPLFSMYLQERSWSLNGDTLITDWMDAIGIDYDVITDEDVHYLGARVMEDYNVIVTGSHPEYWTTDMWDSLVAYQRGGGRMMYLGGNGFYWRTAFAPDKPHMIEVRRAETGARYWGTEAGEGYHSFTGEYGGLWRRLGRPPQELVGIGTVATGFDFSSYYRRRDEASDPRAAFIFDGIEDEIIGNFGARGGGAAGDELDRADFSLGTPGHALIVARSENHTRTYNLAPEETLFHHPMINGEEAPGCTADIVFYECPNGGAVFSVGSIAWAASLSHEDYDNNVSKMTENVVRRFAQDTPFEMPKGYPMPRPAD